MWPLQYAETPIWTCFVNEDIKNPPSKVGYYSKIAKVISTAKIGAVAQTVESSHTLFSNVSTTCDKSLPDTTLFYDTFIMIIIIR